MILVNLKWKTIFDDISEPGYALSNGNCCANLERLLWNFGIGLCGKFKKSGVTKSGTSEYKELHWFFKDSEDSDVGGRPCPTPVQSLLFYSMSESPCSKLPCHWQLQVKRKQCCKQHSSSCSSSVTAFAQKSGFYRRRPGLKLTFIICCLKSLLIISFI